MANEEMEVSIELGRHDLIEDIDIDFEFGAQHDEDLELGDYDQTDEYQHFNSDNRDELMAEDDDASYGMADADDINSNENTTAGNDYDIAIGDADVYTWPEDEVVNDSEGRQVEQVEESASSNTEGTNIGTTTVANSLLHTEVAIVEPEAGQASLNAVGERSTINADEHSTETHDFEDAFSNPAEGNIVQEVTSEVLIESGRDQKLDGTEALQFATTESTEASNSNLKDETHIASGQSGSVDVQLSPAQTNDDEGENVAADDDEIGYDQFEEEQGSTEEAAAPVTASDNDLTNARETRQQDDDAEDEKPADEGDGEFTAEEYQLGDSSFERVDAHNGAEADVLEYRSVSPTMNDQSGIATPANDELEGTDNANSNNVTGDAATIAKRHVMVVHYGETDYQLFADNSDDDPSNFFFKDLSALSLPLGEFLSGIRGVIAEEVSPLDELVLHIDGLGLEFSEVSLFLPPSWLNGRLADFSTEYDK